LNKNGIDICDKLKAKQSNFSYNQKGDLDVYINLQHLFIA